MTPTNSLTEAEKLTSIVFGDTFALYDDSEFEAFIEPFHERLRANGIDPEVFRGKRCLDAGCGGGRASVMMAESGASDVVGLDLSERNVETAAQRASKRGLQNCTFVQGSLLDIPFEDESFDLVWCNGVLHHTEDPDKTLIEVTRVLRKDGHLWLYLYGSGGIYWSMADWVRETLAPIDVTDCIYQLRLMSVPVRRIAEWIDDWFTAYLRRYTVADVASRLSELGYSEPTLLTGGTIYDTSQRLVSADQTERELMGEGDLRFFCRRTGSMGSHEHRLPDPPGGKGSPYEDGPAVTQFAPDLARVRAGIEAVEAARGDESGVYRVMACGAVHTKVRSLLETPAKFDAAALHEHLTGFADLLQEFAGHS
jgi:ubiquinone/menaquinone biosynthesis C-methylase UbiE